MREQVVTGPASQEQPGSGRQICTIARQGRLRRAQVGHQVGNGVIWPDSKGLKGVTFSES